MDLFNGDVQTTNSTLDVSNNSSFNSEFPFWRLAMAQRVILVIFILYPTAIFFNFTVLITFQKTRGLCRPLNIMHIALMLELFLVKYYVITLGTLIFPTMICYCNCQRIILEIYLSLNSFNIAFVSVLLACLSVLQFLTVKGKKRFVSYKVISFLVAGSVMYSILLAVISFVGNRLQNAPLLCASVCNEDLGVFNNFSFSLIGLVIAVLLPCLIVIFTTMTWTCLIFKKNYIGGDDELNRRIISLVAIMPLVMIFTSVFYFILQQLVARILRQFVTSFYPNWILLYAELLGYLLEGIGGFIYLLVLLYVHPSLRSSWIAMLKAVRNALMKKETGRIHPGSEIGASSSETPTNSIDTEKSS